MGVLFITGIDTDIGKTYATGIIAKSLQNTHTTITQKLIQTGSDGLSPDIIRHRQLMGIALQPFDLDGTTCPFVLKKPASPHLCWQLENKRLDLTLLNQATDRLLQKYDKVLLEGAGGIMTPLDDTVLLIDYIRQKNYPTCLVSSGRLGSINHTLLSIQALQNANIRLHSVVYNDFFDSDEQISASTQDFLKNCLKNTPTKFIHIKDIKATHFLDI